MKYIRNGETSVIRIAKDGGEQPSELHLWRDGASVSVPVTLTGEDALWWSFEVTADGIGCGEWICDEVSGYIRILGAEEEDVYYG